MPTQRGRKRSALAEATQQFKLCGFLHAVLAVKPSAENDAPAGAAADQLTVSLVGISCSLHGQGSDVCFLTENGLTLVPVAQDGPENNVPVSGSRAEVPEHHLLGKLQIEGEKPNGAKIATTPPPGEGLSGGGTRVRLFGGAGRSDCSGRRQSVGSSSNNNGSGRKRRRLGFVHGSMSVIHQLDALRMHNCLQIKGLVFRVSQRGREVRAVVLVDVYLPLSLLLGQQFWKPGMTAAAVLNHL